MLKRLALLATLVGFAGAGLPAHADAPARRQVRQERRIRKGAQSGQLTPREARKLNRQQRRIRRMRRRTRRRERRTGRVDRPARRRIRRAQRRANRRIRRAKHNARVRK